MPEEQVENNQEEPTTEAPQGAQFAANFQATSDFSALIITVPVQVIIPIDVLINCIQQRAAIQQRIQHLVVPKHIKLN